MHYNAVTSLSLLSGISTFTEHFVYARVHSKIDPGSSQMLLAHQAVSSVQSFAKDIPTQKSMDRQKAVGWNAVKGNRQLNSKQCQLDPSRGQ